MAAIRRTIRFTGRVQGVGFRATTQHLARSFAVTGWVRNEADGSVLCVAEGDPEEIDRFVAAVQAAMGRTIAGIESHVSPATGEFRSFEVTYDG